MDQMTREEMQSKLAEALAILDQISNEAYRKPNLVRTQRAVSRAISETVEISSAIDFDSTNVMRIALK